MDLIVNLKYVVSAIVFSFVGLVVYWFGFWLVNRLIPGQLWREIIDEHNAALATVIAGVAIGIAIIIAASIHG